MSCSCVSISKNEKKESVLGELTELHIVELNPSQRDIVTALAPRLSINKWEVAGVNKEYYVWKCPNGTIKRKNKDGV